MLTTALSAAVFASGLFFGTSGTAPAQLTSKPTNTNSQVATQKATTKTAETPAKVVAAPAPETPAVPAPVVVTVNPGDNLSAIATAHGTTALRLFYANAAIANPNIIHPGQQLRVPAETEQLAVRDLPAAPAPVQTVAAPARVVSRPAVAASATVSDGSVWDRLAACEAGGNWAINTGNGYYGGLQFSLSSWRGVGGAGLPSEASRAEQIARGQMLQARQGWGAWPACSSKLGLR
jgi:LysM repeat protein